MEEEEVPLGRYGNLGCSSVESRDTHLNGDTQLSLDCGWWWKLSTCECRAPVIVLCHQKWWWHIPVLYLMKTFMVETSYHCISFVPGLRNAHYHFCWLEVMCLYEVHSTLYVLTCDNYFGGSCLTFFWIYCLCLCIYVIWSHSIWSLSWKYVVFRYYFVNISYYV